MNVIRNIKRLLLCAMILHCASLNAQNLFVKNVTLLLADHSAVNNPCLDNNGDTCALLKIKTDNLKGIEFPNKSQYVKTDYSDGTYFVYIPSMCRIVDLVHKDYTPLRLDMADYGYKRLRSGKVYLVDIDAPKQDNLNSSLVMKVEPKNAKIILDEQEYTPNENGILEVSVAAGKHSYMVSAMDYLSQNSFVSVGTTEAKTISIRLQPILHEVLIECNVDNAYIIIDNVNYGKAGTLKIPQGIHKIRAQAEGYVDAEKEVKVDPLVSHLYFTLERNTQTTHVHATPVRIISKSRSSNMYKNNKKIKGWTNGGTVMLLPGAYMLSDDDGNTHKIVVGTNPMTVVF